MPHRNELPVTGAALGCDRVVCPRLTKGVTSAALIVRAGWVPASVEPRGRPSAATTGAWRTDRALRWGQSGEELRIAQIRRERPSRSQAITLIPPRDGFADSCRAARHRPNRETSDQTGTREYTQFPPRIFVLLTRPTGQLRNRAGLSRGAGQT